MHQGAHAGQGLRDGGRAPAARPPARPHPPARLQIRPARHTQGPTGRAPRRLGVGRERQAAEQGGRHAGRWRWGTARPRVPPDAHREARLATRQLPPMGSWPGDLAHDAPPHHRLPRPAPRGRPRGSHPPGPCLPPSKLAEAGREQKRFHLEQKRFFPAVQERGSGRSGAQEEM